MDHHITIAGKDYKLGLGLRALVLYEQATGLSFDRCGGVLQLSQMLFCILTAYNADFHLSFEEFLKEADDMKILTDFSKWMTAEWERQKELSAEDKAEEPEAGQVQKKITATEIRNTLLYEGGLTLSEVNGLQWYECSSLLEGVPLRGRAIWEANRMTAYVCAQAHSKQKMKPHQLITFPWEATRIKEEVKQQMAGITPQYQRELGKAMNKIAAELF
jgi:hypothetical protein